jgi:predicted 3-demethylubiquinone-9 3-methyltransferase (glyoxalase superfamily)
METKNVTIFFVLLKYWTENYVILTSESKLRKAGFQEPHCSFVVEEWGVSWFVVLYVKNA